MTRRRVQGTAGLASGNGRPTLMGMTRDQEPGNDQGDLRKPGWEARLPDWQQWFNRFCENWIFAFIVAMGIRHFALEAYRIPTASMEPMLYGDPSFSKADHVVVDKLLFRFTGPSRYDVTVFQFPWPEVGTAAQNRRAWEADGQRLDSFPFNPLLHRNFVKRCVVMPGDRFYIAHGDIYLQQEDGSYDVAQKPAAVQRALWQEVYRHGADPGYQPWEPRTGGCRAVDDQGALQLRFSEAGSRLTFTQDLTNLYVKPGPLRVLHDSGRARRIRDAQELGRLALDDGDEVEVSMVRPRFTAKGRAGNIWNTDDWHLFRLTSADLDSRSHGKYLNASMNEGIGDVRLGVGVTELDGSLDLIISEVAPPRLADTQPGQEWRLHLDADGWSLFVDGDRRGGGQEEVVDHHWVIANLDDRVAVYRDDAPIGDFEPIPVPGLDPDLYDTRLYLSGHGSARLDRCAVARDVHYCDNGFLSDERLKWREPFGGRASAEDAAIMRYELRMMREQVIGRLVDDNLRRRLLEDLHAPNGGKLTWLEPIGNGPQCALQAPDDGYLLLGDNSPVSWDGRNWGWVPELNLRGEVLCVVLPVSRIKVVH